MKGIQFDFRNFTNACVYLSYYSNGNIKGEVYADDVRLCEVTMDLDFTLPIGMMGIKDTVYTEEIVDSFMKSGLIKSFMCKTEWGRKMYLCCLDKKIPVVENAYIQNQSTAVG